MMTTSQFTGGGKKLRTGSLVLPVADSIFKWMYFASVLLDIWQKMAHTPWDILKQNRGKIHSLKNVVCYRKDKAVGTQFLPSPLWYGSNSITIVILVGSTIIRIKATTCSPPELPPPPQLPLRIPVYVLLRLTPKHMYFVLHFFTNKRTAYLPQKREYSRCWKTIFVNMNIHLRWHFSRPILRLTYSKGILSFSYFLSTNSFVTCSCMYAFCLGRGEDGGDGKRLGWRRRNKRLSYH